jgi:hypothetical protein
MIQLVVINDKESIHIEGIVKFSLIGKNNTLPTAISFCDNKFNLTNDQFKGIIISCYGKCGNTLSEENLLLKYSSQNVKIECIFTEDQNERLNFFGKILIYNKVYNNSNLNEFFILIAQVSENLD